MNMLLRHIIFFRVNEKQEMRTKNYRDFNDFFSWLTNLVCRERELEREMSRQKGENDIVFSGA